MPSGSSLINNGAGRRGRGRFAWGTPPFAGLFDPDLKIANDFEPDGIYDRHNLESALGIFMARGDEAFLFDERALDAYSVAATEIAYRLIESDPSRALALSDLAIIQFGKLRALRKGGLDVNVASPYYVKARVLANLGRNRESADTCREGLALAYHPGLDRLLHALIKQEKGLSPGSR